MTSNNATTNAITGEPTGCHDENALMVAEPRLAVDDASLIREALAAYPDISNESIIERIQNGYRTTVSNRQIAQVRRHMAKPKPAEEPEEERFSATELYAARAFLRTMKTGQRARLLLEVVGSMDAPEE